MKEKKTGMIVLISILVMVIVLLTGIVIFLLVGNHKKDREIVKKVHDETQEQQEVTRTDINVTAGVQQEASENQTRPVVLKGYEFQIPVEYGCMIAEDVGPVIYMSDIFQLRLRVDDFSYEEYTKDPEHAMQNARDAGGEITKEVAEAEINGRKIAWFRTTLLGDDMVVMWSEADKNRMFSGQMVIFSQDIGEEDFLNVFAQIIGSAEKTDKPDSTEEDLLAWEPQINVGERRSQGSITTDDFTVTFPVPEGFYAQTDVVYVSEEKDYYSDDYMTNDYVSVSCRVTKDFFEDARSVISDDWNYDNAKIKTVEVSGRTYYYAISEKDIDGKQVQYVTAACGLSESGWIYSVEATVTDYERSLTLDDIKGFLSITVDSL